MRHHVFFLLAIAIALVAAASAPSAETGRFALRGTVTSVVDGDTLDVRLAGGRRERIRLIGIDAPEMSPAECLGSQAKARASQLVQGKPIRLVGDATQDTRDRYRRLLAYVTFSGSRDLGRQLIAEGLATVYVYDRPFQRVNRYRAAERTARSEARGLWTRCAVETAPPPPRGGSCAASYPVVCIPPPPPDLDCGEIAHKRFRVRHDVSSPDPHGFDGDQDGIGCES